MHLDNEINTLIFLLNIYCTLQRVHTDPLCNSVGFTNTFHRADPQMDQAKKQARQKRNKPPPQEIINQATGGGTGTGLSSPGSGVASISSPTIVESNAATTASIGGGSVNGEPVVAGDTAVLSNGVSVTMTTDKNINEPPATPTSKRSITPSIGAKST